ncbi:MAG: DUF2249 domain-containing protein [Mucilaginibacter sp.]
MIINAHTKISALLKHHPDALNAIISLNRKFEKLRNPLLRKLVAGRTSIAAASKAGGCAVNDFFDILEPLGFRIDPSAMLMVEEAEEPVPAFIHSLTEEQLVALDVRPLLAAGKDPLNVILEKVKTLKTGQVLKIINSFVPAPLIAVLEKRNFISYTHSGDDNLTETYFYKTTDTRGSVPGTEADKSWDEIWNRYQGKLIVLDVRALEMPLPMTTILDALNSLAPENALYVYHKRIPVFLLPELIDRNFDYRIKEITDNEVRLLIFAL